MADGRRRLALLRPPVLTRFSKSRCSKSRNRRSIERRSTHMRRPAPPDLAPLPSPRRDVRTSPERPWTTVSTVAMDDGELAARFATGDADSVRVIYQTHGRLVFAIAYKVLGDAGLAEEATQQTFIKAWRAASSYDPSRSLAAWLTTIARNAALDIYRRERRQRSHMDLESAEGELITLPPSTDQLSDVLAVRNALEELPDADRELIRLQHYQELTHTEIADHLAIPVGTVKSRSFRAHRRLEGLLGYLRTDPADDALEVGFGE